MIFFTCPHCGIRLMAAEVYLGHQGRCPECGKIQWVESEEPFSESDALYLRQCLSHMAIDWQRVQPERCFPQPLEIIPPVPVAQPPRYCWVGVLLFWLGLVILWAPWLYQYWGYQQVRLDTTHIDNFMATQGATTSPAALAQPAANATLRSILQAIKQRPCLVRQAPPFILRIDDSLLGWLFYQEKIYQRAYRKAAAAWQNYTALPVPRQTIRLFFTDHQLLHKDIGGLAIAPYWVFIQSHTMRFKLADGGYYAQMVTTHELVHIFCYHYLQTRTLPRWFMEGLAVYLSGDRGQSATRQVTQYTFGVLRRTRIYSLKTVDEYLDFRTLFEVLHRRYGESQFRFFLNRVLRYGSLDLWAQALGFKDQQAFYHDLRHYCFNRTAVRNWPDWARWFLAVGVAAVAATLVSWGGLALPCWRQSRRTRTGKILILPS